MPGENRVAHRRRSFRHHRGARPSGMKGYTQQNMIRKITVSWLHDCFGAIAEQKDAMCWQSFDFQAIEEAGIVADVM